MGFGAYHIDEPWNVNLKESPSFTVSVAELLYQKSWWVAGRCGYSQQDHLPIVCTPGQVSSISTAFDGTFVAVVPME